VETSLLLGGFFLLHDVALAVSDELGACIRVMLSVATDEQEGPYDGDQHQRHKGYQCGSL
jgi:hypothetical protein